MLPKIPQWYQLVCQVLQLSGTKVKGPHVFISFSCLGEFSLWNIVKCKWINCLCLMEKKCKGSCLLVFPLTLHSLKWWHHLEQDTPSTSYGIWQQVKWHFIIFLKTSVSQTRLTQKTLGREILTWVYGEALTCLIWLLMSIILSHLCHLDTFSAEETQPDLSSQAKCRPGERISAGTDLGMFPNRIKANPLWNLEENPNLCSLPWDFLHLCLPLMCSGTLSRWREGIALSRGFRY